MKSNPDSAESLVEITLTGEDVDALRKSASAAMSLAGLDYFRFLEEASASVPPSRKTSEGWVAFDLGDYALSRR